VKNISEIDERQGEVRITADGRRITAQYLIGADGANSIVRRLATKGTWFQRGFAIEGVVPYGVIGREPLAEFFFGYVANGYGWLFPKRDHVNVGVYTYDDNVSLSKDQLRAYALDRLGTGKVEHIAGYPLGFGGRRYAPTSDRVVLVGDAAGFAEPLLGEGIHNAVKSGQIAAKAIISVRDGTERDLRSAYRSGLRPVTNDVARCDDLARNFFYGNLDGIGFGALSFPISKAALMCGFAAGKTMYEITNTFFLSPFYSIAVPPSLQDYLSRSAASASGQAKAAPLSS
jgi:flavin-dependent dehydrogenase